VFEVLLRAVALALRENTKHELDLAVERGQLAGDLLHYLIFKLLAVDQIVGRLRKEVLLLGMLKAHDIDAHLELADLGLRVDLANGVPFVHGAASGQAGQGNLADADHVVVFLLVFVDLNTGDRCVVVE